MTDNTEAKLRILLVDDDEGNRKTLALILKSKGYQTETASTGQEALEQAKTGAFAMALVDIRLPDADGVELIPLLQERQPGMEVVLITGYASVDTAIQALNAGAYSYLVKPVNIDELLAIVRTVGDKQRLQEEKQQAEEATQRHVAQLEALHQVSLGLASELDLDTLLGSIVERATTMMGGRSGVFSSYHPDLEALVPKATYGMALPGVHLKRGEGLAGKIWASGEPLIVDDYQNWSGRPASYDGPPIGGVVGVPVRWGDEFLGVLNISARQPSAFAPADANLLGLFAAQAATAIHNARLFETERTAREQAEKLQSATQALSATLDLPQVFERILSELRYVVPYDSASVQELDGNQLVIIGGQGLPNLDELMGQRFDLSSADSPNREVIARRQPIILDDAPARYAGFRREPFDKAGTRSWLGVPLHFGDRTTGLIALDKREAGYYTAAHAELAAAFAAQAAIAIENARLYREAVAGAERQGVLHRAGQEMILALQDPQRVYQAIHHAVAELMPAEAFIIVLRGDDEFNDAAYLYDKGGHWPAKRFPVEGSISGKVIASGESWRVDDFLPLKRLQQAHYGGAETVRSLVAVPLRLGDETVGMIATQSYQKGAYTREDQVVLEILAAQAAVALDHARLIDETRRRNRELALLNQIISASAAGEPTLQILDRVCRELAQIFSLPHVVASLLDKDSGTMVAVAEHRAAGQPQAVGMALPVADLPAARIAERPSGPLVVDTSRPHPQLGAFSEFLAQQGVASALLLPLVDEGQVAGSLCLADTEARDFTPDEIDLGWRVARQVASALARVRLEREQQRLTTAVTQAADSIMITDTQGDIVYVNPAFERISGYSREEAMGQNPRFLKSGMQDAALYRDLWQTIGAGRVWRGRLTNRRKDGSLYTIEMIITPLRSPAGEIISYIATRRDVTRELQLEAQFHQAQKMDAIGRLAGGVAHDFNNLLTVIHLSTRLLDRKMHTEDPLRSHVRRIRDAGRRATNLTQQLLAFSRREIVEPRTLDLNQLLKEFSDMLRRLISEDIVLTTHLAADLWPVKIDPTQIEQVVVNLVVNARDAMASGGVLTIETSNRVLDEAYAAERLEVEAGQYVMLAISDNGTGMTDEVKEHLFEPFFTTKEQGKGTGLGLSTVFGIIKQNHGHIGVYSEVGQGTTFKVYLPRDTTFRTPAAAQAGKQGTRPAQEAVRTETVLVVEDEEQVRELTCDILKAQGYQVLEARDGVEAIQVAQGHDDPIHLLLTDVVMPRMSGKALAEQLASSQPQMRVLYVSGYTDNAIVHHGVLDEGVHFLSKPFEIEALTWKVRDILDS